MLQREIDLSSDFIHSIARLQSSSASDNKQSLDLDKLQTFIDSIATMPDLISARVYDTHRKIAWSTQKSLIGRVIGENEELDHALHGNKIFEIEEVGHHAKEEHDYLPAGTKQFVESYIPIRDESSGEVIGVVEMYKYPQSLFDSLAEAKKLVALISLGGGVLLFLFLFWIVSSANRTITFQRESLGRAREKSVMRNEKYLSRIGAELHDGPAQAIGFALLRLDAAMNETIDNPEVKNNESSSIRKALLDALQDIRNISGGLAIPELSDLDGKDSFFLAVDRYRRRTLMPVDTAIGDIPENLSMTVKTCIYRIVQEGLNNVYRHAPEANVTVTGSCKKDEIIIKVHDDGPGFSTNENSTPGGDVHLGLAGLKERVESVGGRFHVRSNPGQGVEISAHIPVTQ